MMSKTKNSGLLGALFKVKVKVKDADTDTVKDKVKVKDKDKDNTVKTLNLNLNLVGGDIGYNWHRQNSFENLKVKDGIKKRDIWIKEVRDVVRTQGVNWKTAMNIASTTRKVTNPSYNTVKETVVSNYKQPGQTYRQNRHLNKHVLTEKAANELLKSYYKSRGSATGNLKLAETSMKTDIAKKRAFALEPCKTRTIEMKNGRKRNIAVKTSACADSWLYRKPKKYDITKVDHGNTENALYNVTF
jgi:hypothetical protein